MNSVKVVENHSFARFLYQKDLLQLIIAVYLGTVLQDFFNSFVNGIIMPLMILLVPNSKFENFEDIQVKILGVDMAVGDVIMNMIKMMVGFMITYFFVTRFLYKYLKEE
jgi:large-conductance mechanosensitive channel